MLTSHPPKGGGVPLAGWRWDDVPWRASSGATTWADVTCTGTWDGAALTAEIVERRAPRPPYVPRGPLCASPDGDPSLGQEDKRLDLDGDDDVLAVWVSHDPYTVNVLAAPRRGAHVRAAVRRTWAGLLCIEERDLPSPSRLRAVQDDAISLVRADTPLGRITSAVPQPADGVLELHLWIVTDEAIGFARGRWGDAVRLVGFLEPID
ncbi:MAG TPA: hypothetical protein VEA78_02290 [Acidimicrobiales bacterium]|nr:hypothetical protein [Acidimicrobiales bacterium]